MKLTPYGPLGGVGVYEAVGMSKVGDGSLSEYLFRPLASTPTRTIVDRTMLRDPSSIAHVLTLALSVCDMMG